MATVTSKGQITLPKKVREALGLVPGSQVDFVIEPERVVIRKHVPSEAFQKWEGYLRGKLPADSVDDLIESLRGEGLTGENVGQ